MMKKSSKKTSQRHSPQPHTRSEELKDFKLGSGQTDYSIDYDPTVLEAFANKNPQAQAWTTFICTEFTSVCPKTGQPDFARIYINYIANEKMIESKSLKLYLVGFRNHGDFHEDCVQTICEDLFALIHPHYLEVVGEFTPRGGIAIYPYASKASGVPEFRKLKQERFAAYAPGKYSMPLNRIY